MPSLRFLPTQPWTRGAAAGFLALGLTLASNTRAANPAPELSASVIHPGGQSPGSGSPQAEGTLLPVLVATKVFKPFVMEDENGQLTGFTVELWEAVAKEVGVTTQYAMTESVVELLDTVASGRARVGAAGITVTAEREKHVDFTYPYFESGLRILVEQAPLSSPLVVLKTLFSQGLLEAVAAVMVVVLIIAHIMWLVERRSSPEQFPHTYWKGIWEALWWSAVTVTTVGYGDKSPAGIPGRVVGLVWMFAGMVLISYFTAAVTAELTISRLEGSIQSPRDLAGKIVATPDGSTAHKYLLGRGIGTRAVTRIEEAYALLLAGEVEAVVYDSPVLQYYATHDGSGKVAVVGNVFHQESYGFALTEGSDLRERIDRAMLMLRENGEYYRIYRKWFGGDD